MNNVITDNAAMIAAIKQAGFIVTESHGTRRAIVRFNSDNAALTVELLQCVDTSKHGLPAWWHKRGYTPTRLRQWWYVIPSIDKDGEMRTPVCINPMIKKSETWTFDFIPTTNFAWVLEATPENLYKLLAETKRRFLACEKYPLPVSA